jgi:chemotaxis family two-component system response regulator Rcp1
MTQLINTRGVPVQVLLIEDSPGDVRLTQEAFKAHKVHISLHVARDGQEAMEFLLFQGKHANAPRPDLILLDLNLPRKDGREVLREIKASPSLMSIPVVVLTTSASEADILRSYQLHANCFITKPVGLERFLEVVHSIDNFWLSVVNLPVEPPADVPLGASLEAPLGAAP